MMNFSQNLSVCLNESELSLTFGKDLFHPAELERRYLKDIRSSLLDPQAKGPEVLYTIAMDVGKIKDRDDLQKRNLLYGMVAYNDGLIGNELVRSQGHIHAVSASCGSSTPEVYEIWQGKAYIYMQEFVSENAGRCFAIIAEPGDIVIVPPNWAHYTVNASQSEKMLFGAWCIRDYSFDYQEIRAKQGLAFYPVMEGKQVIWKRNPQYDQSELTIKLARAYPEFSLSKNHLYEQYEENNSCFDFVTDPLAYKALWEHFQP